MADSPSELGDRVAGAMGLLLQRRTRVHLYDELVVGVSGVTPTTYPVISGVARLGPVTATELAVEVGLDRTVASRHASELVAAGLLHRDLDPQDPRRALLSLTPAGGRAVLVMRSRLAELYDRQLAGWPPRQAQAFVDGLVRFVAEGRAVERQPGASCPSGGQEAPAS